MDINMDLLQWFIYIDKRSATSANKSAGTHTGTDINSNSDSH